MKISILAAFPLCLPFVVNATPYVYPYNFKTGNEVVSRLLKAPSSNIDFIERDIINSYVNGIKDPTQGSSWCFTGIILPHELNIELAWSIRATRKPADLNGNAAPLFLAELAKRYPCISK